MKPAADTLRLTLAYQPPLAWDAMLSFLGGRGAAGVEAVVDGRYLRTVRLDGAEGWLAVSATKKKDQLAVELSPSLEPVADRLSVKLRQLLDLDADPRAIARVLGARSDPQAGGRRRPRPAGAGRLRWLRAGAAGDRRPAGDGQGGDHPVQPLRPPLLAMQPPRRTPNSSFSRRVPP